MKKTWVLCLCLIIPIGLLLQGCNTLFPESTPTATLTPTATITPTPTYTPTPTNTPTPVPPTRTPFPTPIPLPLTTQPQCGTIVTSNEFMAWRISEVGQSELTFTLVRRGIQTYISSGQILIEQLEVSALIIGGQAVNLKQHEVTLQILDTEFGRMTLLTGDVWGNCLVIVVTPEQYSRIVDWLGVESAEAEALP